MSGLFIAVASAVCLVGQNAPAPAAAAGDAARIELCVLELIDDIEVSAQEDGQIRALEAKEGYSVEAGSELGNLEDNHVRLQADVAQAEWDVAQAEADNDVNVRFAEASRLVAQAAYDLVVQANAQADRAVPKALVMQRRFELRRAELQVEQSEHEHDIAVLTAKGKKAAFDAAADQIERRKIRAPISGLIIEIKRKTGEWVRAGDPVLRIVRMDQLRVLGTVKVADFNRSEIMNRPVTVDIPLAHGRLEQFQGKITFAHPEVFGDGTYSVWAEIPNREEGGEWLLQPGLPASMTVHLNPVAAHRPRDGAEPVAVNR